MKYSIGTLLAATAYAALAFAAIARPYSYWPVVNFYVWLGVVVWFGTEATRLPSNRGAFALGALASTLGYVAAATFENTLVQSFIPWLDKVSAEFGAGDSSADAIARTVLFHRWVIANGSLVFGLLGGCLTLWSQQRREKYNIDAR